MVQARLHTAPAGFVYLGQAPDGRAVSLAVLTRGAAYDAAARDRFITAVREAGGRERSGMRGWLGRSGRPRGAVLEGMPEVLAFDGGGRRGWRCRTRRGGRGPSGSWSLSWWAGRSSGRRTGRTSCRTG
ncbi:hypothetical protein ACFQ0B_57380 [Nonomuraea thailandensis]